MTAKDFIFVYDRKVMLKLKDKGFNFIICAKHEVSDKKFFLYVRTDEITEALNMIIK